MRTPDARKLLAKLARALDALGVRWYVFGAQAVIAAGAVRFTRDIDITTEDVDPKRLRAALAKEGFILRDDIEGIEALVEHHRVLPLADEKTGYRVDVVRAGPGIEERFLDRVIFRKVGRRKIPFVETNDLLVLKTLAGRPRDLEDIRTLVGSDSPEVDVDVVRTRLREFEALIDDSTLVALFDAQIAAARGPRKPH